LILITDGQNTGLGDPLDASRAAQQAGVRIFCIGVGSSTPGAPVPDSQGGFKKDAGGRIVLSRLDESLLTRMAVLTQGIYVRSVAGDMDLDAVYQDRIRPEMKSATVETGRKQVWVDRFQWPLAVAIGMLLVALALPTVKTAQLAVLLAIPGALLLPPINAANAGPLQKGYDAYQQDQYDKALGHFIAAQLKDPQNPLILYNIGNAYYKTSNFDAAARYYAQALAHAEPDLKAELHYNLGNSAYRQGRLQEAIGNYETALKLNPQDRQARENLEFVRNQMRNQAQQPPGGESGKRQQDQTKQPVQQQDRDEQQQADQQQGRAQSSAQPQAGQGSGRQQSGTPEYGSQMGPELSGKPGQPDDGRASAGSASQNQPDQHGRANQTGGGREPESGPGSARAPGRSHMLNRLQDQPGRAMMPDYRKRAVEKDW
jgi:Ca-activated chloride channel family protein